MPQAYIQANKKRVANNLKYRGGPKLLGLFFLVLQQFHRGHIETLKPTHPGEAYIDDAKALPRQRADVYLPSGSGPYPSVILVHGGAGPFGNPKSRAMVFSNATLSDSLNDVENAISWWVNRASKYSLNAQRVAIVGLGSGGTLAMLGAQKHHRALCHVISIYGYYDWVRPTGLLAWLMRKFGIGEVDPIQFSPIEQAEKLPIPTTILHGTSDRLSRIEYAKAYALKRESLQLPVNLHLYSDLGHGFLERTSHPRSLSAVEEILAALESHRSSLDW
jgi:acetyl esterase/lipase